MLKTKTEFGSQPGTGALLWLTRSLCLTCQFIENLLSRESSSRMDTYSSLYQAYLSRLAKHHSWMVQNLFK